MAEIQTPTVYNDFSKGITTEKIAPKYELVGSHTARKTFISNFYHNTKDVNLTKKIIGITVKIKNTTERGKHILGLLQEMAKTGKDIEIEHIPNNETIKAMKDAEKGKGTKVNNVDELFDSI